MSSDEEDYMSSDFLQKLEREDVRPGLVFSTKTARKNELEKRKLEADQSNTCTTKKPRPTLKESLATPLDKNNKGFSLLAKMGFKEGCGLGKSGEGMKDPVPLNVKVDRSGLGTDTVEKERKVRAEKVLSEVRGMRDKAMRMQRDQFRSDKQNKFYERRLAGILYNNQKVCHQLDSRKGILSPECDFYWPVSELEEGLLDNEDDYGAEVNANSNEYFSEATAMRIGKVPEVQLLLLHLVFLSLQRCIRYRFKLPRCWPGYTRGII